MKKIMFNEMKDIDFEQELYNHFGQVKDFTLGMRIGQYFYNLCKEQLMKEAVEGFIFQSEDYYPKELIANYNGELKHGDKVRIIIVKDEAKKPVPNDLEEAAKYIDEDDFD